MRGPIMLESAYQSKLKQKLKERFPGCIVLKDDATQCQGIPDLLVLYGKHWAMLEVKRSVEAPHQPNQDYWVKRTNEMSFAAFIYPENEEDILNAMEQSFQS